MATIDFRELATLINLSKTTSIDLDPKLGKEGRWSLHSGQHTVHTSSYPIRVLYFFAAATIEDIQSGLRAGNGGADLDIVYAPSRTARFDGSNATIARLLRGHKAWSTREYLVSFIRNELDAYLKSISNNKPSDYIDPRVETPAGFRSKIPNPVLSFLEERGDHDQRGQLGILLAEPGQGKTYMSHYLVSQMATTARDFVPLLVDSSQWESLLLEDQRSLSKTIAHSFRHYGATIGWLDGNEDQFIRTMLKADAFRVVFDGFDEYVLRDRVGVQPMDVLETLDELASTTSTRILITSRTSFWETNLAPDDVAGFLENSKAAVFHIEPFDLSHATNYFDKKLSSAQSRKAAVAIYSELQKDNKELVGRGFVLSLVADVARERDTGSSRPVGRVPMLWLLESLCRRESLRQQLALTAEEQLEVFRTIAVERANPAVSIDTTLLELAISYARPTLDSQSTAKILEKLKSHPLLAFDSRADRWKFRQEQIFIFLLADQLADWSDNAIAECFRTARLPAESWQDVGTTVVDLVIRRCEPASPVGKLRQIIAALAAASLRPKGGTTGGGRLTGTVALTAVEKLLPKGSSHKERSELLVALCGPAAVTNITFTGSIARFDLSNVIFERCGFENVAWANCTFTESTRFVGCEFTGGVPLAYCSGFGSAFCVECRFDPAAEAIRNGERVREGQKQYSKDDLLTDMHSVLRRFISRGGVGMKTVSSSTLLRGLISASQHRDEIIDALKQNVLEEHHISNSPPGFHVRPDAEDAIKFYAVNNIFTGKLRETHERLLERLNLA